MRSRMVRRVEWRVEQASLLRKCFPPGESICSASFNAAGIEGMQLIFYPSGYQGATDGFCSLYLYAPAGATLRCNLFIGDQKRDANHSFEVAGAFGRTNFCRFEAGLDQATDSIVVALEDMIATVAHPKVVPGDTRSVAQMDGAVSGPIESTVKLQQASGNLKKSPLEERTKCRCRSAGVCGQACGPTYSFSIGSGTLAFPERRVLPSLWTAKSMADRNRKEDNFHSFDEPGNRREPGSEQWEKRWRQRVERQQPQQPFAPLTAQEQQSGRRVTDVKPRDLRFTVRPMEALRKWLRQELLDADEESRTWRLRAIQAEAELRALQVESKTDDLVDVSAASTKPQNMQVILGQVLGLEKYLKEAQCSRKREWETERRAKRLEERPAATRESQQLQARLDAEKVQLPRAEKEAKEARLQAEVLQEERAKVNNAHHARISETAHEIHELLLSAGVRKTGDIVYAIGGTPHKAPQQHGDQGQKRARGAGSAPGSAGTPDHAYKAAGGGVEEPRALGAQEEAIGGTALPRHTGAEGCL
eukprot:g10744.t1